MNSTIAGIAVIVAIGAWHLRNRRHPRWRSSRDGRFYVTLGYPFLAVAVYFLAGAADGSGLDWILANAWALVSTCLFVYGFQALDAPTSEPTPVERPVGRPAPVSEPMSHPGTTGS
jgi:uncharacterized membrane protein